MPTKIATRSPLTQKIVYSGRNDIYPTTALHEQFTLLLSKKGDRSYHIERFIQSLDKPLDSTQYTLLLDGVSHDLDPWEDFQFIYLCRKTPNSLSIIRHDQGFRPHPSGFPERPSYCATLLQLVARLGNTPALSALFLTLNDTKEAAAAVFDAYCWALAFDQQAAADQCLKQFQKYATPALKGTWLLTEWPHNPKSIIASPIDFHQLVALQESNFIQLIASNAISGNECLFFGQYFARANSKAGITAIRERGYWLNLDQRKALAQEAAGHGHAELATSLISPQIAWAIEQHSLESELQSFQLDVHQEPIFEQVLQEALDHPELAVGQPSPLLSAALTGDCTLLETLCRHHHPSHSALTSALGAALDGTQSPNSLRADGCKDALLFLLKIGAPASSIDGFQYFKHLGPLHQLETLVPLFLSYGASPDHWLQVSCCSGNSSGMKSAIEFGAPLTGSAFSSALDHNHLDCARYLLDLGLKPSQINKQSLLKAIQYPQLADTIIRSPSWGLNYFKRLTIQKAYKLQYPAGIPKSDTHPQPQTISPFGPIRPQYPLTSQTRGSLSEFQDPIQCLFSHTHQLPIEAQPLFRSVLDLIVELKTGPIPALAVDQPTLEVTLLQRLPKLIDGFCLLPKSEQLIGVDVLDGQTPQQFLMDGLLGAQDQLKQIQSRALENAKLNLYAESCVLTPTTTSRMAKL